jgi:carboxymethylenebutenolidase
VDRSPNCTGRHPWLRATLFAVCAVLSTVPVAAGQTVEYSSGTERIEAHVGRPDADPGARLPAVIVIHDSQGFTDAVRDAVRLLAAEGFVALGPDLVSRLARRAEPVPAGGGRRPAPVAALSLGQTVQDVTAAFAYLQADAGVDPDRISVVGFGWGGWRAFKLAELTPTLHRAVVFYGTTSDDRQLHQIRAPVLAHYAEYDFQTTAQALATKRRLGERFTYYIYPDMDRGFLGDSSGAIDYVALVRGRATATAPSRTDTTVAGLTDAVRLAWRRTLDFLR